MATRTIPLVNNAVRHPRLMMDRLTKYPCTLRDETSESVRQTAIALARAGMRKELSELCNKAGLDEGRRAIIASVCRSVH